MLLGSGELGKEVVIEFKRLGIEVVAVDRYPHAPAMQVADSWHVIDMRDGDALRSIVEREKPDYIVPEIEAINTSTLVELEKEGYKVVPTARAAHTTMNREAIRRLAHEELGLKTAGYGFANSLEELKSLVEKYGKCVVKPIMSSSGKGQSVVESVEDCERAWEYANKGARGEGGRVIVEQFIEFDTEITLLTAQVGDTAYFCAPIGHRQVKGDYVESWQPAPISEDAHQKMQNMARKVVNALGGSGIFGVEFFVKGDDVWFSEVSPRPHDTGMVTMVTQRMSQFKIHVRAILGFEVDVGLITPGVSKAIKSRCAGFAPRYEVKSLPSNVELRIFGKPETWEGRRLAVLLGRGEIEETRTLLEDVAKNIKIEAKNKKHFDV